MRCGLWVVGALLWAGFWRDLPPLPPLPDARASLGEGESETTSLVSLPAQNQATPDPDSSFTSLPLSQRGTSVRERGQGGEVSPKFVTVRWEDPAQTETFVIEGAHYRCRVATLPARILSLQVDGKDLLGPNGIGLQATTAGHVYRPTPRDFVPHWNVWRRAWTPARNARARMNAWNAGPYYWEAHLLEIPLIANATQTTTPLRGHLVFHATPDALRIELRVDAGADPSERNVPMPSSVGLEMDAPTVTSAQPAPGDRQIAGVTVEFGANGAAVLGQPGAKLDARSGVWRAPLAAGKTGAVWVIHPLPPHTPSSAKVATGLFADDLQPLPASAVTVTGGYWQGWDAASGLYRIRPSLNPAAFSFEESFMNPNRRDVVGLTVRNASATPRTPLIRCETGIGNLEAAVLTDPFGFPLPTPVQVCKNFAGELEESVDTAYGDAYFPLSLAPNETRDLQVACLDQAWGDHPLKQVSSIRFFNVYWHLSTGASETTCFTQNWMQIGRSGILTIPDFRPLTGPMMAAQPQHDCLQWPGFVQYDTPGVNASPARLVYERTTFTSISPNLARFTNDYHTSDDAATASLSVMEIPQRDEMRTFVHLRCDWHKDAPVTGDARHTFRWLNLFEKHTPEQLLWTAPDGATHSAPIAPTDTPMLTGEPLAADSPFVASHAATQPVTTNAATAIGQEYHCLVLVRHFHAKLGGVEYDRPSLSAQFGKIDGAYYLTVPTANLTLHPGDYIDADVMLMPFSGPTPPAAKPERERLQRFGSGLPTVTNITAGRKLADFPATLAADNEVAGFTLSGGHDEMPIVVSGFRKSGVPLLWRDGIWQNQQAVGGDGYQVEPDGAGGYHFVLLYPIREGQQIPLLVTRADCTTGIAHLRDINGDLTIDAPRPGTFTLKAPILFAPGRNTITPGVPAIAFTGAATSVHAAPLRVTADGTVIVTVNNAGNDVHLESHSGPATLTFVRLVPGADYLLTINGRPARRTAGADGTLGVGVPVGSSNVAIVRDRVGMGR